MKVDSEDSGYALIFSLCPVGRLTPCLCVLPSAAPVQMSMDDADEDFPLPDDGDIPGYHYARQLERERNDRTKPSSSRVEPSLSTPEESPAGLSPLSLAWQQVFIVEKKGDGHPRVRCKHCFKEFVEGAARIKGHLLGIDKNVATCPCVPAAILGTLQADRAREV